MRVNQSKFTVCFSDLSWESFGSFSIYPRASAVHQYLKEYCKRYIPEDVIRLRTTVKSVERIPGDFFEEGHRWRLQTTLTGGDNIGQDGSFGVDTICAVIEATGFDSPSSLAFLPSEVKDALDYDPTCFPAPFILDENYLSMSPSIPELAVVGFPGAYWPLFEMQARATVRGWTSSSSSEVTYAPQQLEQRSKL